METEDQKKRPREQVLTEAWRRTRVDLRERAAAGAGAAGEAIRTHPYAGIGFAFGLGVLLGVLLVRPPAHRCTCPPQSGS